MLFNDLLYRSMKIIAFAGSSSRESINKKLVTWVSTQFEADVEILDLNDFEVPIYSIDKEKASGIPDKINTFSEKLAGCDLILLSLAEHNGAYSSAFKNVFDWASRIKDVSVFHNKPMFLMATSPGGRGGSTVLDIAKNRFEFNGGKVIETFSLPGFHDNFDTEKGITKMEYRTVLEQKLLVVKSALNN